MATPIEPHIEESELAAPLGYQLLRAALGRFNKKPSELAPPELEKAIKLARKQYELESMVMESMEAREIVVPESVVDQSVKKIEERYSSHEEFIDDLSRNGIEVDSLRGALHRELFVEAVLDRVGARAPGISDIDIAIYYHMHRERFQMPETRTARHILITINADFPENSREAAHDRINMIAQRLQKKPKRFVGQARMHSECPSAMTGGVIGRVARGKLFPELDDVLFTLESGQISEIVESPLGFHLLLCEEIHRPAAISLRAATPKVREILTKRGRRMCQKHWLSSLSNTENNQNE